jgi:hypothetical protein
MSPMIMLRSRLETSLEESFCSLICGFTSCCIGCQPCCVGSLMSWRHLGMWIQLSAQTVPLHSAGLFLRRVISAQVIGQQSQGLSCTQCGEPFDVAQSAAASEAQRLDAAFFTPLARQAAYGHGRQWMLLPYEPPEGPPPQCMKSVAPALERMPSRFAQRAIAPLVDPETGVRCRGQPTAN